MRTDATRCAACGQLYVYVDGVCTSCSRWCVGQRGRTLWIILPRCFDATGFAVLKTLKDSNAGTKGPMTPRDVSDGRRTLRPRAPNS